MNKPKTIIAGIGNHGEKIANDLNKQNLHKVDFFNYNQLIENYSENIFILFIIYNPEDNCIEKVDKIAKLFTNKTVFEIIITNQIKRKNPHYIINNLSTAVEEISTLIKTYVDLARFPTRACVDRADIIGSLKDGGKLQMKELIFEANDIHEAFSKQFSSIITSQKIKTIWIQIYLQANKDLLYIVIEKLTDAISSNLDNDTYVLWNESYENPILKDEKNKCIVLFW